MNSKQTQTNTFTGGLNTDTFPLTSPDNILTDCINGTILTNTGDEPVLQNDMGNVIEEKCTLPSGFMPLQMKSWNNILYIASRKFNGKADFGSFPSVDYTESSKESILEESYDIEYLKNNKNINYTDLKVNISEELGIIKLNPEDFINDDGALYNNIQISLNSQYPFIYYNIRNMDAEESKDLYNDGTVYNILPGSYIISSNIAVPKSFSASVYDSKLYSLYSDEECTNKAEDRLQLKYDIEIEIDSNQVDIFKNGLRVEISGIFTTPKIIDLKCSQYGSKTTLYASGQINEKDIDIKQHTLSFVPFLETNDIKINYNNLLETKEIKTDKSYLYNLTDFRYWWEEDVRWINEDTDILEGYNLYIVFNNTFFNYSISNTISLYKLKDDTLIYSTNKRWDNMRFTFLLSHQPTGWDEDELKYINVKVIYKSEDKLYYKYENNVILGNIWADTKIPASCRNYNTDVYYDDYNLENTLTISDLAYVQDSVTKGSVFAPALKVDRIGRFYPVFENSNNLEYNEAIKESIIPGYQAFINNSFYLTGMCETDLHSGPVYTFQFSFPEYNNYKVTRTIENVTTPNPKFSTYDVERQTLISVYKSWGPNSSEYRPTDRIVYKREYLDNYSTLTIGSINDNKCLLIKTLYNDSIQYGVVSINGNYEYSESEINNVKSFLETHIYRNIPTDYKYRYLLKQNDTLLSTGGTTNVSISSIDTTMWISDFKFNRISGKNFGYEILTNISVFNAEKNPAFYNMQGFDSLNIIKPRGDKVSTTSPCEVNITFDNPIDGYEKDIQSLETYLTNYYFKLPIDITSEISCDIKEPLIDINSSDKELIYMPDGITEDIDVSQISDNLVVSDNSILINANDSIINNDKESYNANIDGTLYKVNYLNLNITIPVDYDNKYLSGSYTYKSI